MSSQGSLKTALSGSFARVDLKSYAAELPLGSLDRRRRQHPSRRLSEPGLERTDPHLPARVHSPNREADLRGPGRERKPPKGPETGAWKRQTLELMQASITRAKYEKKIELDLLFRVSLMKFLTQEIGAQFASLLLEAKEWIRSRGEYFERSEQAHVMKARLVRFAGQPAQYLSPGGPARLSDPG